MPISSFDWQSYSWKNELKLQLDRIVIHAAEILDDELTLEHDPYVMLERALVLAAFSIRRMVEKTLVTDAYSAQLMKVRAFPAVANGFRKPYHSESGRNAFSNYNFAQMQMLAMKPGELANEIIHSSHLMAIRGEDFADDGLLIASDRHLKRRVLHLTLRELTDYIQSALNDRIGISSDTWEPLTGEVNSTRS